MRDGSESSPGPWPAPFLLSPRAVVLSIAAMVLGAWLVVIVVDLFGFPAGEAGWRPIWEHLFNDRPIEWLQWLLLPLTVLSAAYLSARLDVEGEHRVATFFLLFSLAAALMVIEDAGDVRHVLSNYARLAVGDRVMGIPIRVVSDVPYFAVLAFVPLYAIVRYARDIWRSPRARSYLIVGYGLYALAGGGSGIRHLGDFYIRIGRWIDGTILGSRFPVPPELSQDRAHFLLVDSMIEESIETIAAACFLAVVLAFISDFRSGSLRSDTADRLPLLVASRTVAERADPR